MDVYLDYEDEVGNTGSYEDQGCQCLLDSNQ